MDRQTTQGPRIHRPARRPDRGAGDAGRTTRRQILKYGACGLASAAAAGAAVYALSERAREVVDSAVETAREAVSSAVDSIGEQLAGDEPAEVFKGEALKGELWQRWQKHGWTVEARHYLKLGQNVHCKLCPNECILEPEDRSHCRDRVNKDGTLYTLVYGNPASLTPDPVIAQYNPYKAIPDPVEKKPLFHFLRGQPTFSIAASGCGFRCLNCQNWELSQAFAENLKGPRGEPLRLTPSMPELPTIEDHDRVSMFPEDVLAWAEHYHCPIIAYTYSEPTVWYEYMYDTAKLARQKGLRNVWVTCGYINQEPLEELCAVLDAANVDLKSFSDETYKQLNSGKLEPILNTLKTLRKHGVWFEVTNLIVPTYTDDMGMIREMCEWMVEDLGPDYPLHFSRFRPQHKLRYLPATPAQTLVDARDIAREAGLHYVYIGNAPRIKDAGTTFCPKCGKTVIERVGYRFNAINMDEGKCGSCNEPIAGVWS